MYESSIEDPAGFWSEIASQFYWNNKWDPEVYSENIDVRKGTVKFEWFKGGSTNISYNALDRNIEAGNGGKVAIYWEGNEPGDDGKLTYAQLLEKVCQVVFAGFSAESLAQRIIDCKPKVVITCNAVRRGSKSIHLKEIVDNALIESVKHGVSVGMLVF
ncbi:hypothetical protein BHM03_00049460 [Ensete ventricosum]|nr:hypothetical protein BHM03_00049460 [Ensete ventricosum]